MANALIGGLLAKGAAPGSVSVIERFETARAHLNRQYGVHASAAADEPCADCGRCSEALEARVGARVTRI